jgi:predicted secreted protein
MSEQVFEVSGAAGEPIELPIGNVGATGYSWTVDCPDGVVAAGETRGQDDPGLGDPTGSKLLVRASEPGDYELTARLARPWEDQPIQTVTIQLTVT